MILFFSYLFFLSLSNLSLEGFLWNFCSKLLIIWSICLILSGSLFFALDLYLLPAWFFFFSPVLSWVCTDCSRSFRLVSVRPSIDMGCESSNFGGAGSWSRVCVTSMLDSFSPDPYFLWIALSIALSMSSVVSYIYWVTDAASSSGGSILITPAPVASTDWKCLFLPGIFLRTFLFFICDKVDPSPCCCYFGPRLLWLILSYPSLLYRFDNFNKLLRSGVFKSRITKPIWLLMKKLPLSWLCYFKFLTFLLLRLGLFFFIWLSKLSLSRGPPAILSWECSLRVRTDLSFRPIEKSLIYLAYLTYNSLFGFLLSMFSFMAMLSKIPFSCFEFNVLFTLDFDV